MKDTLAKVKKLALDKFVENGMDTEGIHGEEHWNMVALSAAILVSYHGYRPELGYLFGYLHDCCRLDDFSDYMHGRRAETFFYELWPDIRGPLFIEESDISTTIGDAIYEHADGGNATRPLKGALWDADRLDLARVDAAIDTGYISLDCVRELLCGHRQRIDSPAGTMVKLYHGRIGDLDDSRLRPGKSPVYLTESSTVAGDYGDELKVLLCVESVLDLTDPMSHAMNAEVLGLVTEAAQAAGFSGYSKISGEPIDVWTMLEAGSFYQEVGRDETEIFVDHILSAGYGAVRLYEDSIAHNKDGEPVATWMTRALTNTILL